MNKYIFWGLGFSATTSILAVQIFGHFISVYNLLYAVSLFILIKGKQQIIKPNNMDKNFVSWMLISILSSLFGFFYFIDEPIFQSAAIKSIPKIVLYLLFFVLIRRSYHSNEYSIIICKGLLYGCIFNLIWAIVDAIVFYITGISITNELFASYLIANDIRYYQASLIIAGTIRACGINYDPANLGLFAPIVALYALNKKSICLYILALVSIFASISHTATIGIIAVTLIYFLKSNNIIKTIFSFAALSLLIVVLISYIKNDVSVQMTEAFIERAEAKADGSELEGNRGEYWLNFIPAVIHQPSALFIGTGYNTASYAYLKHNLVHHEFDAYDPEQTYFATYFDIGLVGFLIFIRLLYGLYNKYKIKYNSNEEDYQVFIYSGVVASSITLCGYHYTLYSVLMLTIITGLLCKNK